MRVMRPVAVAADTQWTACERARPALRNTDLGTTSASMQRRRGEPEPEPEREPEARAGARGGAAGPYSVGAQLRRHGSVSPARQEPSGLDDSGDDEDVDDDDDDETSSMVSSIDEDDWPPSDGAVYEHADRAGLSSEDCAALDRLSSRGSILSREELSVLGIPSSDQPSVSAAASPSSQFGVFSRDLRRPHSSPPLVAGGASGSQRAVSGDDAVSMVDHLAVDDAANDSLDVTSSLGADDFAALTAMLNAVSDCSDDDDDDEDDAESLRGHTVVGQDRMYDESIEVDGGGSSVCSSRDYFSPMADWQELQRSECGLVDLEEDDSAAAAGGGRAVGGVIMRELPIGGMPCAALPERSESENIRDGPGAYDDLDVIDEVRALFAHIDNFQPQRVALTPVLKPFIVDMLPALRDPDPMISVPRPDGDATGLGIVSLDEHHNRLLPVAGGTTLLDSPLEATLEDAKEFDAVESEAVVEVAGCFGLEAAQLLEFAEYLDVDTPREPELLPLVAETMVAPLPSGWVECEDDETGMVYYHNEEMRESRWEHPLDAECRKRLDMERQTQRLLRMGLRTARRASLGMVATLFAQFDVDLDGWLNRGEYRKYLMTIGVWACSAPYTDLHWGWTWRSLCENHAASSQRGLGPADFAKRYLGPGREAMLASDFVRAADAGNPLHVEDLELYCNEGRLLPVLRPWTSRAALVAAERLAPVNRVIAEVGAPCEAAVAFILLTFYRVKHPEFAHMQKVRRVIGSFQAQAAARKESGPTWVALLWAAFAAEGAAPLAEFYALAARAQAAVTIQVAWRRWYQRSHSSGGASARMAGGGAPPRKASLALCDQLPRKAAPTPVSELDFAASGSRGGLADYDMSACDSMAFHEPVSSCVAGGRLHSTSGGGAAAAELERQEMFFSPHSPRSRASSPASSLFEVSDMGVDSNSDDEHAADVDESAEDLSGAEAAANALVLELVEGAEEYEREQQQQQQMLMTLGVPRDPQGEHSPQAVQHALHDMVAAVAVDVVDEDGCDAEPHGSDEEMPQEQETDVEPQVADSSPIVAACVDDSTAAADEVAAGGRGEHTPDGALSEDDEERLHQSDDASEEDESAGYQFVVDEDSDEAEAEEEVLSPAGMHIHTCTGVIVTSEEQVESNAAEFKAALSIASSIGAAAGATAPDSNDDDEDGCGSVGEERDGGKPQSVPAIGGTDLEEWSPSVTPPKEPTWMVQQKEQGQGFLGDFKSAAPKSEQRSSTSSQLPVKAIDDSKALSTGEQLSTWPMMDPEGLGFDTDLPLGLPTPTGLQHMLPILFTTAPTTTSEDPCVAVKPAPVFAPQASPLPIDSSHLIKLDPSSKKLTPKKPSRESFGSGGKTHSAKNMLALLGAPPLTAGSPPSHRPLEQLPATFMPVRPPSPAALLAPAPAPASAMMMMMAEIEVTPAAAPPPQQQQQHEEEEEEGTPPDLNLPAPTKPPSPAPMEEDQEQGGSERGWDPADREVVEDGTQRLLAPEISVVGAPQQLTGGSDGTVADSAPSDASGAGASASAALPPPAEGEPPLLPLLRQRMREAMSQ